VLAIRLRRIFLAGLLTAILIGYIGPVTGYFQQRSQLHQEQAHLAQLVATRDHLRSQLADLDRSSVLEERARALGLIQPGERSYLVRGELDPPAPAPAKGGGDGGPLGWLTGLF
jgi:cell division protein FtsB